MVSDLLSWKPLMAHPYFHDQKARYPLSRMRGSNLPEAATTAMPGLPELSKNERTRLLLSGDQIVTD